MIFRYMEQLSEDEILRTVEVFGLSEDTDPDDVFGQFENRRIGGGTIQKLQMRATTAGTTLITFEEETVVNSLLSRQEEKKIRISGATIELRRCEKPKPVPVIGRTVVISGIPEKWEQDDVIGMLENARKGGGPVETVSPGDTYGVLIVNFVDQSVAEHLVASGEVAVGGAKMKVSWPMQLGKEPKAHVEEEVQCPRSVVILDFPKDEMESLTLHLESRRQGGGKLESTQSMPNGSIVATFVEEKSAAKFLERGVIKVNRLEYQVTKVSSSSESTPDVSNTIEVSGIAETTSEEYLRMYFENERRSGGGEIKTLSYDRQEGQATITFCDPKAVLRIIEKPDHKLGSETFRVVALESLTPDLVDQVCAVRVSNLPETTTTELIMMYFESEKRSGGSDFDEFFCESDNHSSVIVYKSREVCKRVVNREHKLESVQLRVEVLKPRSPPPIVVGEVDERKLLASYLPGEFEDENLKSYLEKASDCDVTHFYHGPLPDVVLVDFKNVPNYRALRKLVVSRPFQGQMIAIQKVKPCASILIRGAESLSDDMITLHFENSRRSGGGEIRNMHRDGSDVIIEYCDRTVIPKVLKTKQVIEKQQVKTELYHDCLANGGYSRRAKIQIPEELTVPADKRILKFISENDELKAEMESEMQEHDGAIQWQNPDDGFIKLSCTLTAGAKNLAKRVTKWDSICTEKLNAYLEKFHVKQDEVSPDIWVEFVKEMNSVTQGNVKVEFDGANHVIQVLGLSDSVAQYFKTADEIRNRLLAQLAKKKKVPTATLR